MANYQAGVSDIFHALSDPTRCAIVSALCRGEQAVSVLAAPFDMALPSFMKHVSLLERSGLIRTRKAGRTRTCELMQGRLSEAEQWIAGQRAIWEARSDRMVDFVERLHEEEQRRASKPRKSRRTR
ncbi:ArsR/SmtB family transcription factor [Paraburkholderia megapolitana]|jgi:DNA-binding transcriptional ArsR family regulator|uniref:Transcriptional regulator, ArsR family n=1 Tax=Paraburkholderia megapolitana TaxID=420953 RepID=A0A1I3T8N3_9BURK|nr:metalloregulator ArsR/SmtB family transcription factor [Paraburkholderia megapolitana]QDQ81431.1 helix-turn-helix transcriptional regulator [Paraburkholderia megapolitana]SFJ65867.1 transcriptional regulator, ArsR family [Paraburkholderia megapolitana]